MRPPRTPMQRRAVRRLMAAVPDDGRMRHSDPVAYWDRRTSGNDARAALSLACGARPDQIDPVTGTHDSRPSIPAGERTAGTNPTQ